MSLIHFRIAQICFITDCTILMEIKCKFAILITSKLWIFTLEKDFSHKLTCIMTHGRQNRLGILKYNVWMGFDLPQYTVQYINGAAYITEKKIVTGTVYLWPLHSDQLTLVSEKNIVLLMCGSCNFFLTSATVSLWLVYLRKTICHKELHWWAWIP